MERCYIEAEPQAAAKNRALQPKCNFEMGSNVRILGFGVPSPSGGNVVNLRASSAQWLKIVMMMPRGYTTSMTKRIIIFSSGALATVLGGLGVLYALHFFSPEYRAEQETLRTIREIEQQYASDTYGGKTPEETMQLFIDALRKGDTDLAAKYFVIDKQEEWRKNLAIVKKRNFLGKMVKDLERKKYRSEISPTFITYEIANDKNLIALTIYMTHVSNGIWKIARM